MQLFICLGVCVQPMLGRHTGAKIQNIMKRQLRLPLVTCASNGVSMRDDREHTATGIIIAAVTASLLQPQKRIHRTCVLNINCVRHHPQSGLGSGKPILLLAPIAQAKAVRRLFQQPLRCQRYGVAFLSDPLCALYGNSNLQTFFQPFPISISTSTC